MTEYSNPPTSSERRASGSKQRATIQNNSKVDFGSIENGCAAFDLPPEGQEKERWENSWPMAQGPWHRAQGTSKRLMNNERRSPSDVRRSPIAHGRPPTADRQRTITDRRSPLADRRSPICDWRQATGGSVLGCSSLFS